MYESCLEFILYLALEEILAINNERKASIDNINRYRKKLFFNLKAFYEDCIFYKEEYKDRVNAYIEANENMSDEEFEKEVKQIVSNDNLLRIDGGYIYVSEDLDLENLSSKKFETETYKDELSVDLCHDIIHLHYNPELLVELKMQKPIYELKNLIMLEKTLENLYLSDDSYDRGPIIDKLRMYIVLGGKHERSSWRSEYDSNYNSINWSCCGCCNTNG